MLKELGISSGGLPSQVPNIFNWGETGLLPKIFCAFRRSCHKITNTYYLLNYLTVGAPLAVAGMTVQSRKEEAMK